MKTSNKLLLGFLMVVFLLPLCTFFVLKGIVKEGKYTVKYNPYNYNRSGATSEKYKVVKIVGTNNIQEGGGLICVIHHSDSAYESYNYSNYNDGSGFNDSLCFNVIKDTLVVQRFIINMAKDTSMHYHTSILLNIDLYLPSYQNISVDNAIVQLDKNKTENLSVILNNNASVIFGASPQNQTYSPNPLPYGSPTVFKNINILSSKSSVLFNPNTSIDSLYLNVDSASKINFPDSLAVKSLKGSIDKKAVITFVGSTFGISKRVEPLVK